MEGTTPYRQSTYGQPAEQTTQDNIADTSATTDNNTQNSAAADNGTPIADAAQAEQPIVTPEENVTPLSISLGDEPITETNNEQSQQAKPSTFNWKEEVKKVDRKEVLKELGLDDFAIEMGEYLEKGGKAIDYLNAKSIDYNQIHDEDIVKDDLRKQFPTFTKEEINRLFTRKYGIDENATDYEKEDALLQLKADAHTKRQLLISEQQKFKIPEAVIPQTKDEAYEQWKEQQASQPAAMERLAHYYNEHEATKALNESKRVTINLGEGVAPLHFAIDKPEVITKVLTDDGSAWSKLTSTQSGEPDVPKQQLLTLIAINPQQFITGIFNYGLAMGERKQVKEGQNAQKPQAVIASMSQTDGKASNYRTNTYGGGK